MTDRGDGGGRRFRRAPVILEVQYRTAGAFLVAYSLNLSKGGIFIELPDEVDVGTSMTLRFEVPGAAAPLEATGVVAWRRAAGDPSGMPPGVGVEFEALDARYGEVIDAIVAGFEGIQIAVVAPEGAARAQLVRYLRGVVSCDVAELTPEAAAEAPLAEAGYDLVVIDLDGARGHGPRVLEATKPPRSRPAPALVIAERAEDRTRALELGAAEALATPIVFNELQAAVLRALGRPATVR